MHMAAQIWYDDSLLYFWFIRLTSDKQIVIYCKYENPRVGLSAILQTLDFTLHCHMASTVGQ